MFSNTFVIEKLTHVNRKVNSQDEKTITKANIPNNERANSLSHKSLINSFKKYVSITWKKKGFRR